MPLTKRRRRQSSPAVVTSRHGRRRSQHVARRAANQPAYTARCFLLSHPQLPPERPTAAGRRKARRWSQRGRFYGVSRTRSSQRRTTHRFRCPRTARRRCVMTSQGTTGRSPAYGRLSVITLMWSNHSRQPSLPNLVQGTTTPKLLYSKGTHHHPFPPGFVRWCTPVTSVQGRPRRKVDGATA